MLEYDDVLNKHREAIYKKRDNILEQESVQTDILGMIEHELEQVVLFHTPESGGREEWNIKEILEVAGTIFTVSHDATEVLEHIRGGNGSKLEYTEARTKIVEILLEQAKSSYANMEKHLQESMQDPAILRKIEKGLWLRAIDTLWVEHLDAIEHLRRGIGLRAYGQQEPLVAYKKEAYRMFQELQHLIEKQVVYAIYKVGAATQVAPSLLERRGLQMSAPAKTMERGQTVAAGLQPAQGNAKTPATAYVPDHPHVLVQSTQNGLDTPKVGRNDQCPCGSGKKYKKCHGANL